MTTNQPQTLLLSSLLYRDLGLNAQRTSPALPLGDTQEKTKMARIKSFNCPQINAIRRRRRRRREEDRAALRLAALRPFGSLSKPDTPFIRRPTHVNRDKNIVAGTRSPEDRGGGREKPVDGRGRRPRRPPGDQLRARRAHIRPLVSHNAPRVREHSQPLVRGGVEARRVGRRGAASRAGVREKREREGGTPEKARRGEDPCPPSTGEGSTRTSTSLTLSSKYRRKKNEDQQKT